MELLACLERVIDVDASIVPETAITQRGPTMTHLVLKNELLDAQTLRAAGRRALRRN